MISTRRMHKIQRRILAGLVCASVAFGARAYATFAPFAMVPGGTVQQGPAADMRDPNSIDLFGVMSDNQVWNNFGFNLGGSWQFTGWVSLGGACNGSVCNFHGSRPSSTVFTQNGIANNFAVTARQGAAEWINPCLIADPDGTKCTFQGWSQLPGQYNSDVAIVFLAPSLFIYGEGLDARMYQSHNNVSLGYSASNWTAPVAQSTGLLSSPVGATVLDGNVFVVVRGNDNANYYLNRSSDGINFVFSAWPEIPGPQFITGPALSSWSGGHLEIFGIQWGGQVMHATSNDSGAHWTTYSQVGTNITAYPPAAFSPQIGVTHLFETFLDYHVYHSQGP